MKLFEKIWSKLLAGIAAILPIFLTGNLAVNAEFQAKYGVANDMPSLYGISPVYQEPTFWEGVLKVIGYVIIPVIIIVLIIVGIKRAKNKRKK